MSLVADYGSDSEGEDQNDKVLSQEEDQRPQASSSSSRNVSSSSSAKPGSEGEQVPSGTKLLFNPKAFRAISTGKSSVKRFVVDLKFGDEAEDEVDEEEKLEQERKKRKLIESRGKGSEGSGGLTALLPPPKNSAPPPKTQNSSSSSSSSSNKPAITPITSVTSTASMIPYSLQKKREAEQKAKQAKPAAPKPVIEEKIATTSAAPKFVRPSFGEEEDEEDEEDEDTIPAEVAYDQYGNPMAPGQIPQPQPAGPQLQYPEYPGYSQYPGMEEEEEEEEDDGGVSAVIQDQQFQKILPKYGKDKGPIEIKEVDSMKLLNRKQGEKFDPTKADPFHSAFSAGAGKGKVSTKASKKHQITWLASRAVELERELQERSANGRMTKKQTQAKYGF